VVPAARVHAAVVGLNGPVPLLVKLTEPVGVVAPVAEVSVTVAVQVVAVLTVTEAGTQFTAVVVEWATGGVTVRAKVPWLAT